MNNSDVAACSKRRIRRDKNKSRKIKVLFSWLSSLWCNTFIMVSQRWKSLFWSWLSFYRMRKRGSVFWRKRGRGQVDFSSLYVIWMWINEVMLREAALCKYCEQLFAYMQQLNIHIRSSFIVNEISTTARSACSRAALMSAFYCCFVRLVFSTACCILLRSWYPTSNSKFNRITNYSANITILLEL